MAGSAATLADLLDARSAPGEELCERLDGGAVRCYACGHRCLIRDGRRGICKVRFNRGGTLYVPRGYVAALQSDPVEKKPFFHLLPGRDALTFGMLGCDYHCSYCFPGDTVIITDRGPADLAELFSGCERVERAPDGEIAYPAGRKVVAASGSLRGVGAVFKHPYRGELVEIRPRYLPALRCTPDHSVYATTDPAREPAPIQARWLTTAHYLAIPRWYAFSSRQRLDVADTLCQHRVVYRVPWKLTAEEKSVILEATARGESSREIAARLGKDASYIRHIRSKHGRGRLQDWREGGPITEGATVRFPNERRPGIPRGLPVDEKLASLLGYYCGEGCVVRSRKRPNSYVLSFSFSPAERETAEEVRNLLHRCLGLRAQIVPRETTLAVVVGKASAALLFASLGGVGASGKRVPSCLWDAERPVVEAFLRAYVKSDGCRYPNGKVTVTTVSRELAYGVAWLALKRGHLPSLYEKARPRRGVVLGREVRLSPYQYTVCWYEDVSVRRRLLETDRFYLVPIRDVRAVPYDAEVYNLEVEEEHNYLAGFFLVSNCQNWVTSQALRDEVAGVHPTDVTAERLVALAERADAGVVASSYNEPLITAEWAVEVFRPARARGFHTAFISNGNATPEVLDYLRPWTDGYKIDLKTMSDRSYRKLGGVLEHVLDAIRMTHERGFWVEVVTLVVPGFNDAPEELRAAAEFIASVSPDIPWHVTAFHQDYKMTDSRNTAAEDLIRAAEIGVDAGLHFVYAGNLPGQTGSWEDTRCPGCGATLIRRFGYMILEQRTEADGRCPDCGRQIPGLWVPRREPRRRQRLGVWRLPHPLA